MDAPLDERITNLEIKLTYQDDLIHTLNEVIIELRGEVDRLSRTVALLEAEARRAQPDSGASQEKPPHY